MTQEKTSPMLTDEGAVELALDYTRKAGALWTQSQLVMESAQVQAKKLLKWLKEPCPHTQEEVLKCDGFYAFPLHRIECPLCLEELERMVGE